MNRIAAPRTGGCQTHESYNILTDSDAMVREHWTLRRELRISRIILILLLIIFIAFCAVRCLQHDSGEQNAILIPGNTSDILLRHQADKDPDKTPLEVLTPLTAFLHIATTPTSDSANLKWQLFPEHLCFNFSVKDTGESLVIPRGGWYRLGLQITYINRKYSGKNDPIILAHDVFSYSSTYNWESLIILSVRETVNNTTVWEKSIFSEIVHVFHEHDLVKVKSYSAKFIDSTGYRMAKTFLTVQLISVIEVL